MAVRGGRDYPKLRFWLWSQSFARNPARNAPSGCSFCSRTVGSLGGLAGYASSQTLCFGGGTVNGRSRARVLRTTIYNLETEQ